MAIEIRGGQNFNRLAAKIRTQLTTDRLVPDMRDGIVAEAPQMRQAVYRSMDAYLPNRYASVLRGPLNIGTTSEVTGNAAKVTLTATANGRHIGTVNAGNLRHPFYGRSPWYDQGVRRGFVSEPMDSRRRQIRVRIRAALRKFLGHMTRGR